MIYRQRWSVEAAACTFSWEIATERPEVGDRILVMDDDKGTRLSDAAVPRNEPILVHRPKDSLASRVLPCVGWNVSSANTAAVSIHNICKGNIRIVDKSQDILMCETI